MLPNNAKNDFIMGSSGVIALQCYCHTKSEYSQILTNNTYTVKQFMSTDLCTLKIKICQTTHLVSFKFGLDLIFCSCFCFLAFDFIFVLTWFDFFFYFVFLCWCFVFWFLISCLFFCFCFVFCLLCFRLVFAFCLLPFDFYLFFFIFLL